MKGRESEGGLARNYEGKQLLARRARENSPSPPPCITGTPDV